MQKPQCLFDMISTPKVYHLAKPHVMALAAEAGYKTQADVYKRLGKDETVWSRRFKSTGWKWESILALCYVLGCTPEVLLCQ